MGLLSRRPRAPKGVNVTVGQRSLLLPNNVFAPGMLFASSTSAGVEVSIRSALRSMAHWGCQRVLVATISAMPVDVLRNSQPITPPMMVRRPSGRVSRRAWVAQLVRSGVSSGNMYGKIVDVDSLGRAMQMETVHPDDVEWRIENDEEVPYLKAQRQTLWPLGDFWHVPVSQFLQPGTRVATSPTDTGKTAIGVSIAAEEHGARYFGDGMHPTMIAKANVPLSKDQAQAIKESLSAVMRGNRETPVLGADISLEKWQTSPADWQFVEILQFEVLQACRLYGVSPSKVYAVISGSSITYQNINQEDVQFLKYDIHPWLCDLEDAWSDLIAIPQSVKFNPTALLRMDAIAQANLFETELKSKTTTVNEVRVKLDRPTFPDPAFDDPGIPGGQKSVADEIKAITPGVNVVVTPDEARQILNDAGADLPIPAPDTLAANAAPVPVPAATDEGAING